MTRSRSRTADGRIDMNMTPMIDVVFQLLTFFLMSFRVASAEGDFSLLLPRDDPDHFGRVTLDEVRVRVVANVNGDLWQIQVDSMPGFAGRGAVDRLHAEVVRLVALTRGAGQETPTVVLDADDGLRYEHLMQVVAAVSQQVDETGNVASLAKKIKFAPPR